MFRTAYTEDFMATLAHQCMPLWNDLEADLETPLREMSGLLNFGDPEYGLGGPEGTLTGPIPNLEKYGMAYTELTRDQIEAQNPFHNLPDTWIGLDMPDNGVINVPHLTRSLYARCEKLGVTLVQYAEATHIMPDPQSPGKDTWLVQGHIASEKGSSVAPTSFTVVAPKIAITCGAFVNHVLYPSFGFHFDLDIWEMVSRTKLIVVTSF
jgi:sarcosine oxidase / L-pipecolate oxidase